MSNKDIRWKAVDEVIKSAFLQILSGKRFNDISISEICSLARISRGTFYRHFENTNSILECLFQDISEKAISSPSDFKSNTSPAKMPLCLFIRSDRTAQCLVKDPYIRSLMAQYFLWKNPCTNHDFDLPDCMGADSSTILYKYFSNACLLTIAENLSLSDEEWNLIKQRIDHAVLQALSENNRIIYAQNSTSNTKIGK